jgi:hypothetical protein
MAALAKAQDALAKAIADTDRAEAALVAQQEKVDRLQKEVNDLQNAARTLKEKFGEGSDAYREMKAAMDQKVAELANANSSLALLTNQASNAAAAARTAQASVDGIAQNTVAVAVANKIKAEQAVEKAQMIFDSAKANADNPTVTLGGKTAALSQEAAARGIAEAEAEVAAATTKADAAQAKAEGLADQFDALDDKVTTLSKQLEVATQRNEDFERLVDETIAVTLVHGDGLSAVDNAKAVLDTAKANLDRATSAATLATENLQKQQAEMNNAQSLYDSAVSEYGADSSQAASAKGVLDTETSEYNNAQTAANQAQGSISQNQKAVNDAAGMLDRAQQGLDTVYEQKMAMKYQLDSYLAEAKSIISQLQDVERQKANLETQIVAALEKDAIAQAELEAARGQLAEQKFWASNPSGSYTTSIAGIIGARTANDISYWTKDTYSYTDSPYAKYGSPVTISFNNKGDYLAGSDNWRKEDNRIPKLSAMRSVNLDTQGNKMWEWIGPTEGLLVWNPKDQRVFQPTGAEFFGEFTWGKRWSDGYKPLQALDKNKDSQLQGEELRGIWVWLDANIDAVVQDGELQTLADAGVDRLSLRVETDERGGMWVPEGASGKKGTFPTRDWWSMGGMSFKDYDDLVDLVRNTPSLWVWEPNNPDNDQQGGGLGFYASKDYGMIALSVPKRDPAAIAFAEALDAKNPESTITQYVFNVRDLGMDTFRWEADMGFGLLSTVVKTDGSDTITGSTKIVDKENSKPLEAAMWTGRRVSGPGLNEIADVANVSPNYNR